MKDRIPRKLKKKIPKGMYCYTATSGFKDLGDGRYGYTIKPCPFYTSIKIKNIPKDTTNEIMKEMSKEGEFPEEYIGWCKKINYSIDDQCKSCGLRRGY